MSQSFHCRPSEMLGISGPKSFYLDRIVWIFGSNLEAEMSEAEENKKTSKAAKQARVRVLQNALGKQSGGEKRFKDPVSLIGSKNESPAGEQQGRDSSQEKKRQEMEPETLWVEGQ